MKEQLCRQAPVHMLMSQVPPPLGPQPHLPPPWEQPYDGPVVCLPASHQPRLAQSPHTVGA